MSIERALQINTAALAVMGAVFLGLGHESVLIPVLLGTAAIAAVTLTDILHVLRLNRWIANLVALVAVVWSLHDFFGVGSDGQLLAIANMLVYLQVVLLFQEKNARVFWQLMVLSLLQVVVAGALDLGPQFGLLLVAYIVAALSALVLLCIYRDLKRDSTAEKYQGRSLLRTIWAARLGAHWQQQTPPPAWQTLLAPPAVEPAGLSAFAAGRALTPMTIARQVGLLAVVTLLFTAVFFYATPRISDGAWTNSKSQGGALSSYAHEVRLEVSGRIHLSPQVVMRVSFSRLADRRPVPLVGEPYFCGTALTDYVHDEAGSRWVAPAPVGRGGGPSRRPPSSLTATNLVRQDIVLETAHTSGLFAMMPAEQIPNDTPREVRVQRSMHRIFHRENEGPQAGRQYRYALATPAIHNGRQLRASPHFNPVLTQYDSTLLDAELAGLKSFDGASFPQLAETAAMVLREQGVEQNGALAKALALERHFRTPDRYHYSLSLNVARQTGIDPIEDFVANHHQGHCEYFASSLVMMLRSQGIPARMVIGYKGGDFNSLGRYYVVQQRHAHAWVEAWLSPGEVDEREIAGQPSRGGSWYRLDPTPAARETFTAGDEDGIGHRLSQAFDYVELLWRDYVLSLSAERQQDALFDPLTARASAIPAWAEGRSLQRWLRHWSRELGIDVAPTADRGVRRAFEYSLAIAVAAGLLFVVFLVQCGFWMRKYFGRWLGRSEPGRGPVSQAPEFYVRLERLLARAGLRRRRGQTPSELAADAEQRLMEGNGGRSVAALPAELVETYYRVRFGGARLDKNETDAIEHALAALVPAVSQASKR